MIIDESGMTFGPFEECECFHIEKSNIYKKTQDHVKICEFILSKGKNKIYIVEAKSSSPQPTTNPNFENFLDDIYEKLLNSFSLYMACRLKRHGKHSFKLLPQKLCVTNIKKLDVKFILIIKGHSVDWCIGLQNALQKKLHTTLKIWKLGRNSVAVMNETIAKNHNLIQ